MAVVINLDAKAFVIYIAVLKIKTRVKSLGKITISKKYLNYTNIFLFKFIIKFLEYNNNNYIINLKKIK